MPMNSERLNKCLLSNGGGDSFGIISATRFHNNFSHVELVCCWMNHVCLCSREEEVLPFLYYSSLFESALLLVLSDDTTASHYKISILTYCRDVWSAYIPDSDTTTMILPLCLHTPRFVCFYFFICFILDSDINLWFNGTQSISLQG